VLLGGRAAETVVFGHLSTGAADDLAKVTGIARSMALRYGMVEKLGYVSFDDERPNLLGVPVVQQREYSEDTAREIDIAVREIVHAAFDRAVAILTREREVLERGAKLLLEKETLAEPELAELKSALTLAVAA
jgi:cell division protease FtsH